MSAPVRRTLSRCQQGDFASRNGVRSTRYTSVTSGALTGDEAVVETRTPAQADALLRFVVAWRDRCDLSAVGTPNRGEVGISELTPTSVMAPGDAYRWTFAIDSGGYEGTTRIEKLVVARLGNRVAIVVLTKVVPVGTARTFGDGDLQALARTATERLT